MHYISHKLLCPERQGRVVTLLIVLQFRCAAKSCTHKRENDAYMTTGALMNFSYDFLFIFYVYSYHAARLHDESFVCLLRH